MLASTLNNIPIKTIAVFNENFYFHQASYLLVLYLLSSDFSRGPSHTNYERSTMGYSMLATPLNDITILTVFYKTSYFHQVS